MSAADKPNLKQILRAECLPALAARTAYFSHADVRAWLRGRRLAIGPALLREYLSAAMRDGTVHDAGCGAGRGSGEGVSARHFLLLVHGAGEGRDAPREPA